MSVTTRLPWEGAEGKIQPWHRDRLAAVYVRQSTAAQVVEQGESTRLQYGLVERAVALGWARSRVLGIDEDLGHSAAGIDTRPGFARLVSEVGLNHVGLVLGNAMSRLARSGREWHQLLELCALSGALLGDLDGIYDPGEHNDRLLLGLKGTISEAELHLIRQRMWSGRMAKAGRGELAVPLPIGFVRRASGEVALDPDEQVQAVVRLVFDPFERLGTIGAALAFLADAGIELGVRPREGPERGELVWRPSRNTVANLLRNPRLRGHLRLRPEHGGPQTAAGGPTMHRTGAPRARQLAGVPARGRAVLYQRRTVRAEPGADGRQSSPGGEPGSGARGPGPAGRAGRLRPLRPADGPDLPARAGLAAG